MAFNKNRPQQPRGASCGMPERSNSCPKGRIVNGTQSCYGQFPWQVRRFVKTVHKACKRQSTYRVYNHVLMILLYQI